MKIDQRSMVLFDIDDVFETETCRKFARIWNTWRKGKLIPDRGDADITDLRNILAQIGIVEVRSKSDATIRLVGTTARDVSGTEVNGQNWIDLAPPAERGLRAERVFQHVSYPCASRTVAATTFISGLVIMSEYAAFPVLPVDPEAPKQIMGCFHALTDNYSALGTGSGLKFVAPDDFTYLDIGAGIPE